MEKPKNHAEAERKIPVVTIDLSSAWDIVSAIETTLETLERKLNGKQAVYCVFEGDNKEKLLNTKIFFASTKEEVMNDYNDAGSAGFYIGAVFEGEVSSDEDSFESEQTKALVGHIGNYIKPAIAAYDLDCIEPTQMTQFEYKLKPGKSIRDALIVVGKFKL